MVDDRDQASRLGKTGLWAVGLSLALNFKELHGYVESFRDVIEGLKFIGKPLAWILGLALIQWVPWALSGVLLAVSGVLFVKLRSQSKHQARRDPVQPIALRQPVIDPARDTTTLRWMVVEDRTVKLEVDSTEDSVDYSKNVHITDVAFWEKSLKKFISIRSLNPAFGPHFPFTIGAGSEGLDIGARKLAFTVIEPSEKGYAVCPVSIILRKPSHPFIGKEQVGLWRVDVSLGYSGSGKSGSAAFKLSKKQKWVISDFPRGAK